MEQVYFFIVVVLLLVGLGAGLLVLRDIALEAVERIRSDGAVTDSETPSSTANERAVITDDLTIRVCTNCGTENGIEFTYCRSCAQRL